MKLFDFHWKHICCWACPSPLPGNSGADLLLEAMMKYTGYSFTTTTTTTIVIVSGYHGT